MCTFLERLKDQFKVKSISCFWLCYLNTLLTNVLLLKECQGFCVCVCARMRACAFFVDIYGKQSFNLPEIVHALFLVF